LLPFAEEIDRGLMFDEMVAREWRRADSGAGRRANGTPLAQSGPFIVAAEISEQHCRWGPILADSY
jgi:hypothetical protein